jgi:hypothetical protein
MPHAARHDVGLVHAEMVLATANDEHLDALEHDADLLMRVTVQRELGAAGEVNEVHGGAGAEDRPHLDAGTGCRASASS